MTSRKKRLASGISGSHIAGKKIRRLSIAVREVWEYLEVSGVKVRRDRYGVWIPRFTGDSFLYVSDRRDPKYMYYKWVGYGRMVEYEVKKRRFADERIQQFLQVWERLKCLSERISSR